jgi:chromosome segregation protein
MRIKEIEIDNFKSFANKVEIPFLPGFTTISGPNGSGKSNIIDSILFALGLSSSRALRSEKGVGDLISTHNSRNEVYVKVIFEIEEKEGEELSFARKVKKSTQGYISTYYINDKPSSLSQIHFELEKYNITPNSYNVIMQGDVTSITNCSANERRKIIDEIAGVADFDRKLEMAQGELETVEVRVNEANIVLNEIDTRLESLTAEREVALKYKKLKDEKTSLEGQINVVKYFDTKRSLDLVHENILNAQKESKKAETEGVKLAENIEVQKAEFKKLSDEIREKGEDKQLEVKRQAEEKKGEIERKQMSVTHSEKVILDNKKTIENARSGIENHTSIIEKTNQSIEEKKLILEGLQNLLKTQKEELHQALLEISGLGKTADEHIQKRNDLRRALDTLKDEETNILKGKLPLEGQLNNLKNELKDCNENIENYEAEGKNFTKAQESLELQISTLQKELEECKALQRNTLDELDKTKNQIADANHNIQLANRKISEMEAKKQAFKEYGLGAGVETVLNSGLKGVHAPLSQLIDVEGEYSDAISVALGGRSRFVVVDDENVASRAIEILKSSGRDRATFLPLTKLKPAPSKIPLPKDKGVIDFAINLIDFDSKYTNAFYFALSETLVVEDMQTAKKLMGKYRIVTLDGEIFEKSGAITGGARVRSSVMFGKGEDKTLATFKTRLVEFEKQLGDLEHKRRMLEDRLDKIRADFSNASNSYNEAKFELQNLIKNNKQSQDNIEKKLARVNEITPEIAKIEKLLDNYEAKHVELNDKMLQLQDNIASVEKLIDEGELNKLKEKTQGFEENIKSTQNKINEIQNEINTENNNIKFQNTMIEQKQTDIARLLEDNQNLEADKLRFGAEIEEIQKVLKVFGRRNFGIGQKPCELQNVRDKMQEELLETQKQKDVWKTKKKE